MLEAGRRTGVVELRGGSASTTLWLREGAILDAVTNDGARGATVAFRALEWHDAAFEVRFEAVDRPRRIAGTTSALLLEAARRADEASRGKEPSPPHAALQDRPPAPPRAALTAHRALTLMTEGVVRKYNRHEADLSGKDPRDVLGRNFFTEVAPCTLQEFEGRFRDFASGRTGQPTLTFDFVFKFRHGHQKVRIGMVRSQLDREIILTVTRQRDVSRCPRQRISSPTRCEVVSFGAGSARAAAAPCTRSGSNGEGRTSSASKRSSSVNLPHRSGRASFTSRSNTCRARSRCPGSAASTSSSAEPFSQVEEACLRTFRAKGRGVLNSGAGRESRRGDRAAPQQRARGARTARPPRFSRRSRGPRRPSWAST